MHKNLRINQNSHKAKLMLRLLAILTLELFFCQIATANLANRGYTPPVTQSSNTTQRRQAAGSRGCGLENNATSLTLLTPQEYYYKNKSTNNPTIVFDISSIPKYPVIVTLTQPNKIEPVFETQLNIDHSGIWTVIAQPRFPLLKNQQYVWTVMIVCNNLNPSQNIYVRSLYVMN